MLRIQWPTAAPPVHPFRRIAAYLLRTWRGQSEGVYRKEDSKWSNYRVCGSGWIREGGSERGIIAMGLGN
ncbi:unnamed protein product [Microthlaspi erraticum]|uniref:Uncharacterized protein n=1 Tax=Microthlaspi erraticum TaxID=1685480 RepID=A0A6D2HZ18_9BRAS|nr:unnamed protein product [Microthlaspi erraticum]